MNNARGVKPSARYLLFTCPGLGSKLKTIENYPFVSHLLLGSRCTSFGLGLKKLENNPFAPYLLYTCPGLRPGLKKIESSPFCPVPTFYVPPSYVSVSSSVNTPLWRPPWIHTSFSINFCPGAVV